VLVGDSKSAGRRRRLNADDRDVAKGVAGAGHSVCGVTDITDVDTLIRTTRAEYFAALSE
jgi:hypothetical protein